MIPFNDRLRLKQKNIATKSISNSEYLKESRFSQHEKNKIISVNHYNWKVFVYSKQNKWQLFLLFSLKRSKNNIMEMIIKFCMRVTYPFIHSVDAATSCDVNRWNVNVALVEIKAFIVPKMFAPRDNDLAERHWTHRRRRQWRIFFEMETNAIHSQKIYLNRLNLKLQTKATKNRNVFYDLCGIKANNLRFEFYWLCNNVSSGIEHVDFRHLH